MVCRQESGVQHLFYLFCHIFELNAAADLSEYFPFTHTKYEYMSSSSSDWNVVLFWFMYNVQFVVLTRKIEMRNDQKYRFEINTTRHFQSVCFLIFVGRHTNIPDRFYSCFWNANDEKPIIIIGAYKMIFFKQIEHEQYNKFSL